ncbi:DUF1127 domain-containing protein [uncultured Tateyamaria sp.]|uniref:DUF1127 domain-containing protein n=1 Tax=uncultured Tateyamaria sp. TaxID=455651 RepID=UPI002618C1EE|nr:DUF1127 domain-containing protein [uncultured Tateyamaria sp.]
MTHRIMNADQNLAYLMAQTRIPAASVVALKCAVLLSKWATRRRSRLALAQLTPAQLRDVGLTPAAASIEAQRVFWRA